VTKRISLQLAPDTTATHCGSCQHLWADSEEPFDCGAFRVDLDTEREGSIMRELRHANCLAAEIKE